jgi:cation diffusion facilitator CzcD-associated flavoprotein CzcO
VSCRAYIMASGCLSAPKPPEIEGVDDFKGEIYFTGRWPHEEVKLNREVGQDHRLGWVGGLSHGKASVI